MAICRHVQFCRVAVAVVDGARLKTPQLLAGILEQFGYRVELNSTDELLNMLRVIIVQQTRSHISPVLIVQNINHMYPSALCVLCKLAAQKVHSRFALRIVLVGDRIFRRIISSPSMRSIADRLVGDFALEALPEPELPKSIVTLNGETL
jgi:type II secretory pathway predicted ATPase ExeA